MEAASATASAASTATAAAPAAALASASAAPLAGGVLLEALDVLIGRRDELAGRDAELARVVVAALDDGVEPGLVDPDAGRDVSLLARVKEARLGPPFNQMRAVEAAVGAPLLRAGDGRVVPAAAAAIGCSGLTRRLSQAMPGKSDGLIEA